MAVRFVLSIVAIFRRALYLYHSPDKWVREKAITSKVVLGFRKTIEDGTIENRVCHPSLLEGERLYFLA